MSDMIEINLRPEPRTLRQFGFIALVGFGLLAAFAWGEWFIFAIGLGEARLAVTAVLGGLALVSGLFSLVYPKANLPIYVGLTLVSYPIGFVLSYVIMGTLFYGLITPVGLLFKLTGRDPMHRKFEPEAESYWVPVATTPTKERYFKQF